MVRAYRTVRVAVPDIPLPEPGDESWEAFAQLSERFQEHTDLELEKENRLQASEKVWASVGYALTAVAKQRGWQHDSYNLKADIARQIATELSDAATSLNPSRDTRAQMEQERKTFVQDFEGAFDRAFRLHQNFRTNNEQLHIIEEGKEMADGFLDELAEIRGREYHQFTPINGNDQARLVRLNGLSKEFDKVKSNQKARKAFLDTHFPLYKKIEWRRKPGDDDDGGGSGVPVDPSPPGGPPSPVDLHRRERVTTIPAEPRGWKSRRPRSQEPKAPAAVAAQSAKPSRERRRVIAPRPTARR